MGELLVFYTEIQKTFADRLKEFRNQFEMILEGERLVAGAKSQLEMCQEKEARARKEMKRVSKRKDSNPEVRDLTQKVEQAEREKDLVRYPDKIEVGVTHLIKNLYLWKFRYKVFRNEK